MIRGLLLVVLILGAVVLYTAWLNRAFARCPHCQKIGSWRFDALSAPEQVYDEDGNLVQTTQKQRCRRCGGQVTHTWHDHGGREIRRDK